jgi:hypothetical protein
MAKWLIFIDGGVSWKKKWRLTFNALIEWIFGDPI